jgi:hypothetical protein
MELSWARRKLRLSKKCELLAWSSSLYYTRSALDLSGAFLRSAEVKGSDEFPSFELPKTDSRVQVD